MSNETDIALLKERAESQSLRITECKEEIREKIEDQSERIAEIKDECKKEIDSIRMVMISLQKEKESFLIWGIIVLGIGIVGMGTYIWNRIHG